MSVFRIPAVASLGALALLAACGGTPSTVANNPGPVAPDNARLSLSEIRDVQRSISPGYNAASITPKSQVPVSGGANYLGYVQGDITVPGRRTDVSGLMEMGVDFGANRVGGTVGNFVTSGGAPIDGNLSLRNGVLDRQLNSNQVTIRSGVDGTLRTGAGETVTMNGAITNGGFKGRNGAYAGVPMNGNVAISNGNTIERGTFGLTGILER